MRERLLELCGSAIESAAPCAPAGQDWSGGRRRELLELLALRNGFYGFECALHVRPLSGPAGQEAWNAPGGWRDAYPGGTDGHWFFAEDAFGGQFSIRGEDVCAWDPETAEAEVLADSIAGWCATVRGDADYLTGRPAASEWQATNGPLARGQRLFPRTLFVLSGAYEAANLRALPDDEGMRARGQLWQHKRGVGRGAAFGFKPLG